MLPLMLAFECEVLMVEHGKEKNHARHVIDNLSIRFDDDCNKILKCDVCGEIKLIEDSK